MQSKNICGAKTRSGTPCQSRPMENGRCRMHGGKALRGVAHPSTTHGRYSKFASAPLVAMLHDAAKDPELLNLRQEIDLQTVLIARKLDKLETGESGQAWEEAKRLVKQCRKAYKSESYAVLEDGLDSLEDLADGRILHYATEKEIREGLESKRKLVAEERKRLVEMQQMITAEQAMTIIERLLASVRENVKDRDTLNAIQQEFILATQSAHYQRVSAGNDSD